MLEKICEKYGFTYSKNHVVPSTNETLKPNAVLDEALLAKNTDGKDIVWIYANKGTAYFRGNTDNLNLWLYRTRPDLTPEKIIEFVDELNVWLDTFDQKLELANLIDPEDWQEIANIPDASEDVRYTENGLLHADN